MYKFDPRGESVEMTFRAIALAQIDEALSEPAAGDVRSLVHESRRRCKKLRALLRLVRPAFPQFATENAALRDAAGLLSSLRDAEVLLETLAGLGKGRHGDAVERIRQRLAGALAPNIDADAALAAFRIRLLDIRARVAGWSLTRAGHDALLPGLRLTYRSFRRRMDAARRTGLAPHLHDWRKAGKSHGFHLDLLRKSAPEQLAGSVELVDTLSARLGLHHDLTVLHDALAQTPDRFGDDAGDLAALAELIETRRHELEAEAFELGHQIAAERPRALQRRFAAYWKTVP